MSDKTVASFDELLGANTTKYDTVEAYGTTVGISTLSSADMIEWLESGDDKVKSRLMGIRLLVKSIVDKEKNHLPEIDDPKKFEEYVTKFSQKDATENGKVIKAIRKLNGLDMPKEVKDALKNDSGEASTAASPTVSA